jgi:hypothetical protein
MKRIFLFVFAGVMFAACNPIPNKSVFEELKTDELAAAIKADPEFGEEYDGMRAAINLASFSEVQKAQYKDVTYRRLYKYTKHIDDSAYWQPREIKWGEEWDATLAQDLAKVDEKVAYWQDYKENNSLSRFAKVELSSFYITHYTFIGGVDDAYICFNITPVDGTIEQIKFSYSYSYKINNGRGKISHNCLYSSPITSTKEGAWEIPYGEKDDFDGMTVKKFLQNYDLEIEITDVRKDGQNYSLDDLNIPEAVKNFWQNDTPENRDAVAQLVNPDYVGREQYIKNKKNEELKKYDALCYDFLNVCLEENILNELKGLFE